MYIEHENIQDYFCLHSSKTFPCRRQGYGAIQITAFTLSFLAVSRSVEGKYVGSLCTPLKRRKAVPCPMEPSPT